MKLATPNVVVSGVVLVTVLSGCVIYMTGTLSATITIMAKSPRTVAEQPEDAHSGIQKADLLYADLYQPSVDISTAATETPLYGKFEQIVYKKKGRHHQSAISAADEGDIIIVPLIWHVPKSGGTFLKDFVSCLNMTVASESGRYNFSGTTRTDNPQKTLDVLSRPTGDGQYFVNVDVSSPEGIHEAHQLGFVDEFIRKQTNLVVVTSFVNSAARWLFPEDDLVADDDDYEGTNETDAAASRSRRPIRGLLLTVLRHPIDRAASLFHYLKYAKHESTYHPEWQNLSSIVEWTGGEDNWMVRFLSGVGELPGREADHRLNDDDLQRAKAILSNYTLIGLTDRMEESLDRFGSYVGWDRLYHSGDRWNKCRVKFGSAKRNAASLPYDKIQPNTPEWKHLVKRNQLDLKLYQHAVELFQYQGETLFSVSGKTP
jgi:hypothetical protein